MLNKYENGDLVNKKIQYNNGDDVQITQNEIQTMEYIIDTIEYIILVKREQEKVDVRYVRKDNEIVSTLYTHLSKNKSKHGNTMSMKIYMNTCTISIIQTQAIAKCLLLET